MPTESTAVATTDDVQVDEVIKAGAIEQARWRLGQLQTAFSSTMVILADMHQDEDWRYLTDTTGAPYSSFTAMLAAELQISDSWARRQQQGVIDLVVPLRQLTHPDTRIPVNGSDVAVLGKRGAEYVCQHAQAALNGITEPRDQERALRALLDSTRSRITGDEPSPEPPTPATATSVEDAPLPPRTVDDADLDWDAAPDVPDHDQVPVGDEELAGQAHQNGPDPATESDHSHAAPAPSRGAGEQGSGERSPGISRYGTARDNAADENAGDADPADDHDADVDDSAREAVAALAAITDGGDAFEAAVRVVASTAPADLDTLDLDVVMAAMLKLSQLRSKLMAANRPPK